MVPVHGRCGERMSPIDEPSTRSGIELGTFWLAVRYLTDCANLALLGTTLLSNISYAIKNIIYKSVYILSLNLKMAIRLKTFF